MATLQKPGTLPKPGPLARAVRVLLGLLNAAVFVFFLTKVKFSAQLTVGKLVIIALCLCALGEMGKNFGWGRWSQRVFAGSLGGAAGFDYLVYGNVWAPAVNLLLLLTVAAVLATAALSFFLSAVFGTPG